MSRTVAIAFFFKQQRQKRLFVVAYL